MKVEYGGPEQCCEHHKNNGKYSAEPLLQILTRFFKTYLAGGEVSHCYELEHEAEDAEETHQHPDIKIRDIAHLWSGLSHPGVHGDQGEERGHPHSHPGSHLRHGHEQVGVACQIERFMVSWFMFTHCSDVST